MSRLCVKNIPKYVNEDRLRDFFSQKGEITDAKLVRTRDGKSRQFAFVGFRTEGEAEEALNYFNNSYFDTCRITCEVARKVGDPNIPRPWSRYSAKGESPLKQNSEEGLGAKPQNLLVPKSKKIENNDPQLQEFLQVMQPRAKSKLWANDALGDEVKATDNQITDMNNEEIELANGNESNDTLSGHEHKVKAIEITSTKQLDGTKQVDLVSDMDYFKSRVKKNWSDSETDDEDLVNEPEGSKSMIQEVNANDDFNDGVHGDKHAETGTEFASEDPDVGNIDNEKPTSSPSDDITQDLESGRLFVRNLPFTTTEDELMELFSQFGDVSQVHLVVNKDTRRSKGIAYVLYMLPESAIRALENLDSSIFQGRLLHVMPAKPQISTGKLESNIANSQVKKSFKQQREEQRKASEASGDTQAWNSLFIRQHTVVENIARKHGISKSDFLDGEADDPAVRVALAETHVIAETKKALSSAGINIVALEEHASRNSDNKVKRSNHVILVKNLPYGSSQGDLADMFGKFGSLDKIVLPPTKALALIIFLEPAEARSAFKGLSYKRYKDAPLYLEWPPENILCSVPTSEGEQKTVISEQNIKSILLEQCVQGIQEDVDPDRIESRSLFVKNLNFRTSDESLREHFSDKMKIGSIKSIKVKKHVKNGKNVSMGFGFIEFDSVETATNICNNLQGTVLDGHALILQLCHAKRDGQVLKKHDKENSLTKLIVKNVAFEATEKDLRQLFSPFGQVKSLRMPMKFSGHRGFAFVEFVTKQEAQNALQALSSTHLYGRHMVIERAKEGESLEELRAKTAAQFGDEPKLSKKRKQASVVDESNVKFARIIN